MGVYKKSNWSFYSSILLFFCAMIFTNKINAQIDTTKELVKTEKMQEWIDHLYEPGVSMTDDSLFLSIEAQRLIIDHQFRSIIYPETYVWNTALDFIKKNEIKIAFWHFINLYLINDENKNLVVKAILTYDKVLDMEQVLISTFYTYCYMDPEIGNIENGKPEIKAPHVLEKKLQAVKDIIYYINKYNSIKKSDPSAFNK